MNKENWVGIDVAKRTFDAGLALSEQRFPSTQIRDLPWKSFERTEQGVCSFLNWLDVLMKKSDCESGTRIVMEATGRYSTELCSMICKINPDTAPAIANPAQTSAFIKSLGQRNKTDGLEARALAFYGVERRPAAYEPLNPEREELRELERCRDDLVKQRAALKNRMHEISSSKTVNLIRKSQLKKLDKDILKIEESMKNKIKSAPKLKRDYKLLTSIPGVGFVTASTVIAELGDLNRFKLARQLSAFTGLSPRQYQSGSSINGKTHMCKKGNGRVRQALFLAALACLHTKANNPLKDMYKHLCLERGKQGKSALGAVMHKMLIVMRALIISGKEYEPMWITQKKCS